jgi:hypothetical protein
MSKMLMNRRSIARFSLALGALAVGACLGERPAGLTSGDGGAGSDNGGSTSGGSASAAAGAAGKVTNGGTDNSAGDNSAGDNSAGTGAVGEGGGAGEGNVGVGDPVTLTFLEMPTTAYAGSPLEPIKVAITDANGNTVTTASAEVALDFGANPGSAALLGYSSQQTVNGVATFSTVGVDKPGQAYTLTAKTATLTDADSDAFDVKAMPFSRVTTGVYGGNIRGIVAADTNTIYAATDAGVWKSTNRASTWTASNFGSPGHAGTIAADPKNAANLYITPANGSGSPSGPSFAFAGRSDNGAGAWRSMGDSAGAGEAGTFAIDTEDPKLLYAGSASGIYKSLDAGDHWTKTSFRYACYSLTIDPIEPTTLYASAYDHNAQAPAGIFKSVNGGQDWTLISSAPLAADIRIIGVFATPTAVFATASPAKLFRSDDGGATWEDAATSGWMVSYAKSDVQRVFLGVGSTVAVSTNGGTTFGAPVEVGALVNGISVDPTDANRVYVATERGVVSSSDGGNTYTFTSIGISAVNLGAVVVHPTQPDNVLVGGPDAVYRTTNGGVAWSLATLEGPITALTYDPQNANTVYACNLNGTFFKSTTSGQTWGAGVDSGGGPYCYNIVVRGQNIWLSTVGGLRKSTNGGTTFGGTGATNAVYGVDVDATGTDVYIVTNGGSMKSINGGGTFSPMEAKALGKAIIIDPSLATRLFMGMSCGSSGDVVGNGGVRVSANSGATFGAPVGSSCIVKLLGLGSGSLLAATGTGFERSDDHGATYLDGSIGITGESTGVGASGSGSVVYLTTTLGLYKSTSGGL